MIQSLKICVVLEPRSTQADFEILKLLLGKKKKKGLVMFLCLHALSLIFSAYLRLGLLHIFRLQMHLG